MLGQLGQNFFHRPVEIDFHDPVFVFAAIFCGDEFSRVRFQFLDPDAVPVDFCLDVSIRRTRDSHPYGAGGAVTRKPDNSNVQGKMLSPELGAVPGLAGGFQDLFLHFQVPKRPAAFVSAGWQMVQVTGGRKLYGLQARFGRCSAHDEGDMVGRTCRRAQGLHFLHQEFFEARRV